MTELELTEGLGLILDQQLRAVRAAERRDIGFPGATDLSFARLAPWLTGQRLNNIGDPTDPGRVRHQTKDLEQDVVARVADLMRAPHTRWGYVTSGSSEGTEHALYDARRQWPDAVVYASAAAHYSVAKLCEKLLMPLVTIRADDAGGMDVADLRGALARRRDRAAVVVATVGTTMTEAVDDVEGIVAACDELALIRRRIHVDAALSGVPLALLPDRVRPRFDFAVGATSMVISGHKFLSTLMPCGVLVYADRPALASRERISYTGAGDTTISGSRSGHTSVILWAILHALGWEGLRVRADAARGVARYAEQQLRAAGVDARRHEHAMTVYFPPLPPAVSRSWVIPGDGRWEHIVCVPGVGADQIDDLVADIRRLTQQTTQTTRAAEAPQVTETAGVAVAVGGGR